MPVSFSSSTVFIEVQLRFAQLPANSKNREIWRSGKVNQSLVTLDLVIDPPQQLNIT